MKRGFGRLRRVSFMFLLLLLCDLVGEKNFLPGESASFNSVEAAQRQQNQKKESTLRIGSIPQINAVQMVKQWQPFLDYLSKELNMKVELILKPDYLSVITGLANSEMDVALLGSFAYIRTFPQGTIRPLVKRVIFGSPNYHSIIIVRKDSGIERFADLRGKTFAFTDKNSTTGYFLPLDMMKEKGFGRPEAFFSAIIFTGNHESAVLAVHNGSVDGASVSTTRWNPKNPKIGDLKIIWKSEPIPLGPFVARKNLDPALFEKIKKAFLKVGKTPETKDLSRHIEIEGFLPVRDSEYDVVRKIQKKFGMKGFGD